MIPLESLKPSYLPMLVLIPSIMSIESNVELLDLRMASFLASFSISAWSYREARCKTPAVQTVITSNNKTRILCFFSILVHRLIFYAVLTL